MKLYGGIDLHSNNSVLVLIDEEDRVIYEKRLRNDLALILRELASYRKKLTGLVVESTYNWYWLVDGLMEAGYGVHLANTAAIQQYEGLKHTDDRHDARWLPHPPPRGIHLAEGGARGARFIAPTPSFGAAARGQSALDPEPVRSSRDERF